MTTRQSRSSSIPIPRSTAPSTSPTRNIESVISIPFAAPGRPRLASAQAFPQRPSITDDHRGSGLGYGTRGSSTTASSFSLRPTARSFTQTAGTFHRGTHRANTTFEPRVIRASTEPTRAVDTACLPSTSTPPTRTRRTSGTSGLALGGQRQSTAPAVPASPSPPASFTRPAYLEHSALRHMLQTELPTLLPPSRKTEASIADIQGYVAAMSPPTDSDDESNVSPPPRDTALTPLVATFHPDQVLRLPTRWSEQFRHAMLNLSPDGRDLTYQGASFSGDKEAAAARTIHPIPPACGIYYYEVDVLSKGQKGHISIGFAARDVKLSRLPGWEAHSWGYHGDDGCSFAAEKNGTSYGPVFGTGDVIGCGINFTTNRAFFTKNGTFLGPVFENIGNDIELYPSVGLRHSGESVRVNFGHEPFKFDIDDYVQEQRDKTWTKILSTPLDSSLLQARPERSKDREDLVTDDTAPKTLLTDAQTKGAINKLISSYLAHHGYAKTARAFQKQQGALGVDTRDGDIDMEGASSRERPGYASIEDDIELRTRIVSSVTSGDIDTALEDTKKYHPTVLEAEEGLMLFKLRCRKFVELILEAAEMKKRMKSSRENGHGGHPGRGDGVVDEPMNGLDVDVMDVDDDATALSKSASTNGYGKSGTSAQDEREKSDSPTSEGGHSWGRGSAASLYEAALSQAIAYGQVLLTDYKHDVRPEVKMIFKQTFGIVAYEDPMAVAGVAAEVESRVALANELNRAILKSQGRPTHPALETLYRHTAACIVQLGLSGVGAAAFADMPKEFLEA